MSFTIVCSANHTRRDFTITFTFPYPSSNAPSRTPLRVSEPETRREAGLKLKLTRARTKAAIETRKAERARTPEPEQYRRPTRKGRACGGRHRVMRP